jgi:hypothetical protein
LAIVVSSACMIEANITVMVMRMRCWARAVGWTAGGAGLMVVAGGPDVAVAGGAATEDAACVGADAESAAGAADTVGAAPTNCAETAASDCAAAGKCVAVGAAVALGSARAVAAGLGLTSPLQVR